MGHGPPIAPDMEDPPPVNIERAPTASNNHVSVTSNPTAHPIHPIVTYVRINRTHSLGVIVLILISLLGLSFVLFLSLV